MANNKKVVKLPKTPPKDRTVDIQIENEDLTEIDKRKDHDTNTMYTVENTNASLPVIEKGGGDNMSKKIVEFIDDYRSPLEALGSTK